MSAMGPVLLPLLHGVAGAGLSAFELHPSVLIGCLALGAGYAYAIGPMARRLDWREVAPERWRTTAWALALALIFLSLNGPLHELSDEYLFSAHMAQHMVLMLIAPPLLILGLPPALVRRAVRRPALLRAGRLLTHPAAAFVAYNLVFVGWHFPAAYNAALENHDLHIVQHLMFMATSVMMWWPVIAPAPELERLPDGPLLMIYVFALGIPSTILSAFITMSDGVLYPFYAAAPRISVLSPLEDQRLGGLLMWIPGMLIFWVAISAVWFRWTRDEYAEWRREAREAAAART
jgi:putative membrane protein